MTTIRLFGLLILLVWICFASSRQYIKCNSNCSNTVQKNCNVSIISKTPWSKNETTAPPPKIDKKKLNYYFFEKENNTYEIAINLSWSVAASDLRQHITGFFLSVKPHQSLESVKYKFDVSSQGIKKRRKNVFFKYDCIGKHHANLIRPGDTMLLTMHSLPMYQRKTDSQSVFASIPIPGCKKAKMNKVKYCHTDAYEYDPNVYYAEENYEEGDFDYKLSDSSKTSTDSSNVMRHSIIAASVGAVLAILVIIMAFVFKHFVLTSNNFVWRFFRKTSPSQHRGNKVLVLSTPDKSDSAHVKAAAVLADVLTKIPSVDVTCNLWKLNEIHNPSVWTDDKLQNTQSVILVASPQGLKNWYQAAGRPTLSCDITDPFVIGFSMFMENLKSSSSRKRHFYVVYFDESNQILPREIRKHRSCFPMMQKFDKFLKCFVELVPNSQEIKEAHRMLNNLVDQIKSNQNNKQAPNQKEENLPLTNIHTLHNESTTQNDPVEMMPSPNSSYFQNYSNETFHSSSCAGSQCSCKSSLA